MCVRNSVLQCLTSFSFLLDLDLQLIDINENLNNFEKLIIILNFLKNKSNSSSQNIEGFKFDLIHGREEWHDPYLSYLELCELINKNSEKKNQLQLNKLIIKFCNICKNIHKTIKLPIEDNILMLHVSESNFIY